MKVEGVMRKISRKERPGHTRSRWNFERAREGRSGVSYWLFNVIFMTAKMPEEWRWSPMILLYKNKDDIQNCDNYRSIKLLSHTTKIWKIMVEMRVRRGCVYFQE